MKVDCYYPNCDICKVENNCELKEPCNSKVLNLEKEIAFELQSLNSIRRSLNHCLNSENYFTLSYNVLIQLEFDTKEIIRELRRELEGAKK